MGMNRLRAFHGKRVLLLQGPVGPFFRRLAKDLSAAGACVFKVNFNGGDWLFYPWHSSAFRGKQEEWPAYFSDMLVRLKIDEVILFGDCRRYHADAIALSRNAGVRVHVFEEGYVRPDYVTLENGGVNGYSELPNILKTCPDQAPNSCRVTHPVGNTFWHAALWACLYYLAAQLLQPFFRHYRHHRPLSMLETLPWIRSGWRKILYSILEKGVEEALTTRFSRRFYLVPLQVHNDNQIYFHSGFSSVEHFIRSTAASFARHAPVNTLLVIKHHPLDRGYTDYTQLVGRLSHTLGLGNRLVYVHDLHLPKLLQHTRGTVVINSTTGLSSLYHGAPVKVCGKAVYDVSGLTYQGSLDSFWRKAGSIRIDARLFEHFRTLLIQKTQVNGSFYKRLPHPASHTGLFWEPPADPDTATWAVPAKSNALQLLKRG